MNNSTITATSKLCAIIGNPVEHSLSPLIHNVAFEQLGLNYVFLAFKVEQLKEAVVGMRALNLKGVSVTIPHKIDVMDYLDDIEEVARKIGAVNTILNQGGRLLGYNTDCSGAIMALEEKMAAEKRRLLKEADLVVCAAGRPPELYSQGWFRLEADMIKEGAVVVGVGVRKDPKTGKLYFDLPRGRKFRELREKASYITPNLGGVGLMTRGRLLKNIIIATHLCKKHLIHIY